MFDASALSDVFGAPKPTKSPKGLFVTFEGGDGGGKSTQIKLLIDYLNSAFTDPSSPFYGLSLLVTKDPGGTKLGETLRSVILESDHVSDRAEALLYAADRAENIATKVRPALAAGKIVLADRYLDSSIAYQGVGRRLNPADIFQLSLWATEGLMPHLTFLLDVDSKTFAMRRSEASHDRLERQGAEFHAAVRAAYLELARHDRARFVIIEANQSKQKIHDQIVTALIDYVRQARPDLSSR